MSIKSKLSRNESAEFLTNQGFPVSPRTLAKYACIGGGPAFRKFGHRVIYTPDDLIAWAEAKTSSPVTSTSDALAGGEK